jgi:hypothetical protein
VKTLILHRACDEPIFLVDVELGPGVPIVADEWHPLHDGALQPVDGDIMRCPHCHKPMRPNDRDLLRVYVYAA